MSEPIYTAEQVSSLIIWVLHRRDGWPLRYFCAGCGQIALDPAGVGQHAPNCIDVARNGALRAFAASLRAREDAIKGGTVGAFLAAKFTGSLSATEEASCPDCGLPVGHRDGPVGAAPAAGPALAEVLTPQAIGDAYWGESWQVGRQERESVERFIALLAPWLAARDAAKDAEIAELKAQIAAHMRAALRAGIENGERLALAERNERTAQDGEAALGVRLGALERAGRELLDDLAAGRSILVSGHAFRALLDAAPTTEAT